MGEAKVLVNKCKCSSKKAIEKAIADFNAKSKAANTAAWKKSYHMICVLDAKPANQCTVPALPEVKPVPFGKGVADSCKDSINGKPIPKTCDTGFSKNPPQAIGTYGSCSGPWKSSGRHNGQNGKSFKLIRLNSVALNDGRESEKELVNLCRAQGLMAFGCGHVHNPTPASAPRPSQDLRTGAATTCTRLASILDGRKTSSPSRQGSGGDTLSTPLSPTGASTTPTDTTARAGTKDTTPCAPNLCKRSGRQQDHQAAPASEQTDDSANPPSRRSPRRAGSEVDRRMVCTCARYDVRRATERAAAGANFVPRKK